MSTEDNPHSIAKSAFSFLSGTAFSRVSGLVRDISMAFCFGTDPAIAAFIVAYRFASLLRRIFGEGALLTSFVPHFEGYRGDSPSHGARFFRDIFFSLTTILILLIFFIEIGLYSWTKWGNLSSDNLQIINLTMLMFPSLLFLCLYSLCSGLLQCEKKYFLTGIAPVGLNIIWIAAVWWFRGYPSDQAVIYLALSIVIACIIQWLITLPSTIQFLRKTFSWKEIAKGKLFSPEMYSMLGSISLGIIGVSASQINSAIDTIFARYASLEGPAYLNYAIHLQQLPLALFGIGVASALLPPLSRAFKAENYSKYSELLNFSLSKTLMILLPCTFAIFALGGVSINLIYGRGDFTSQSALQTTFCLWGYGIGLVPMALAILLTPAFNARKDFKSPTIASVLSIILNVVLNYFFIITFEWGPSSLALSTSLAALFNSWLLLYQLENNAGIFLKSSLISSSWKTAFSSIIASVITIFLGHHLYKDPTLAIFFGGPQMPFTTGFVNQLIQFTMLFFTFTASLGAMLFLLKAKEVMEFVPSQRS